MGQIWSKRLALSPNASGGGVNETVPANKVWILKHVTAAGNGAAGEVVLFIAGIPVWGKEITPPGGSVYDSASSELFQVLNAGEALELFCAPGIAGSVSGYELSAL